MVPRVSVSSSLRRPIRPRLGIDEFHAHPAVAVIVHLLHLRLARAQLLDHHPDKRLGNVDGQPLHRLHQLAVNVLGHDFGLAHRQLETFAAHHLDQNRQLQLAAAHHLERVGALGVFHAQRNVGEQLFFQALSQIARGNVLPFATRERRRVHHELNGDGRLVNRGDRQRRRVFNVRDGLADVDAGHSRNRDDVAQLGGDDIGPLQPGEREQLRNLDLLHRPVALGDGDVLAGAQRAVEDACDGQAAEIVAVIEIRHQHLQRSVRIALRMRNGVDDGFEQAAANCRPACLRWSKPSPASRWCRARENRAGLPPRQGQ